MKLSFSLFEDKGVVNMAETYYCTMQLSEKCKKKKGILTSIDFYTTSSQFYSNGKFAICKNCLKEYVYNSDNEIDLEKFKNILRIYDIPFFEKEWVSATKNSRETIGQYMKMIQLNYANQKWVDGDFGVMSSPVLMEKEEKRDIINSFDLTDEVRKRWGKGFNDEEIDWLENDYQEWTTNHESSKLSVRKLFRMICIKELEIEKARQNGKPTDKLEKSLRELMSDSNVTPKTMSALNETDSQKTFGQWIRDIEQYRPCEYFEDKSIYADEDNIQSYFERFILRPMKNLINNSREFDKEFNLDEDSD